MKLIDKQSGLSEIFLDLAAYITEVSKKVVVRITAVLYDAQIEQQILHTSAINCELYQS